MEGVESIGGNAGISGQLRSTVQVSGCRGKGSLRDEYRTDKTNRANVKGRELLREKKCMWMC